MITNVCFTLDPTSAAILGINDELWALYLNIKEINNVILGELQSGNLKRTIWPQELKRLSYGKVKKAIDNFLPRISFAFTEEFASLHPNEFAMSYFDFFNVKEIQPLTLQVRYISYSEFLLEMQRFITRVILQRTRYTLPKASYEYAEYKMTRHIKRLLEERQGERVITDGSKTFNVLKEMIIVFENLSAISCNLNRHMVESIRVPVPLLGSAELVMLPIHHCTTCDRYFIGGETLKLYEKLYGRLFIRVIKEGADSSEFAFFGESELHRTGYSVRKDGMTKEERQAFLSKLIDNQIMNRFSICRDIEKSIKIFSNRPEYAEAIAKWKEDLFYISKVNL